MESGSSLSTAAVDEAMSRPPVDAETRDGQPHFDHFVEPEAVDRERVIADRLGPLFSIQSDLVARITRPFASVSLPEASVFIDRFTELIRGARVSSSDNESILSELEISERARLLLELVDRYGDFRNEMMSEEFLRLYILSELRGLSPPESNDPQHAAAAQELVEEAVIEAQRQEGRDIGFARVPSLSQRAESHSSAEFWTTGLSALRLYQAVSSGHPLESGPYRNYFLANLLVSLGFPPESISIFRPREDLLVEGLQGRVTWLRLTDAEGNVRFVNASDISVLDSINTEELPVGIQLNSEKEAMEFLSRPDLDYSRSSGFAHDPARNNEAITAVFDLIGQPESAAHGALLQLDGLINDLFILVRQLEANYVIVPLPAEVRNYSGWAQVSLEDLPPLSVAAAKEALKELVEQPAELAIELAKIPEDSFPDGRSYEQVSAELEMAMRLIEAIDSLE